MFVQPAGSVSRAAVNVDASIASPLGTPAKKSVEISGAGKSTGTSSHAGPLAFTRRHSAFVRISANDASSEKSLPSGSSSAAQFLMNRMRDGASAGQNEKSTKVSERYALSASPVSPGSPSSPPKVISPIVMSDSQKARLRAVSLASIQRTAGSAGSPSSPEASSAASPLPRMQTPPLQRRNSAFQLSTAVSPPLATVPEQAPAKKSAADDKASSKSLKRQQSQTMKLGDIERARAALRAITPKEPSASDNSRRTASGGAGVEDGARAKPVESTEEILKKTMDAALKTSFGSLDSATLPDRVWAYLSFARGKKKEAIEFERSQQKKEALVAWKLVEVACESGSEAFKQHMKSGREVNYVLFSGKQPEEPLALQNRGLDALKLGASMACVDVGATAPMSPEENKSASSAPKARRKSLFSIFSLS